MQDTLCVCLCVRDYSNSLCAHPSCLSFPPRPQNNHECMRHGCMRHECMRNTHHCLSHTHPIISLQLRDKAKEHLIKKEYAEALSCLDLAIDLNTGSYKLYRLRAIAHACVGDFASSSADSDRVIELSPNTTDGYFHKGFALFNLKHYSDAAHCFQQGLKINPADAVLKQGFWDSISLVSQSRTDGLTGGAGGGGLAAQQAEQLSSEGM